MTEARRVWVDGCRGRGIRWADEICDRSGASPDGCTCRVLKYNLFGGWRSHCPDRRGASLTNHRPYDSAAHRHAATNSHSHILACDNSYGCAFSNSFT